MNNNKIKDKGKKFLSDNRRDFFLITSEFLFFLSAIIWYIKLYKYLIWEDENNTFLATDNFILEGFPIRKGLEAYSQYYQPSYDYDSYWQYTLEILLRTPLQILSKVFDNPTIQTFTPLIITIIVFGVIWITRKKIDEQMISVIALGNILLAASGYLMSSFHYVRYYWFEIFGTYICTIIVALRAFRKHTIKDSLVTLIISFIPFAFHEMGGILIVVTALLETYYYIKNQNHKIKISIKEIIFAVIVLGSCCYIVPRLFRILLLHNISITFSIRGVASYVNAVFGLGGGKCICYCCIMRSCDICYVLPR